MIRRTKWIFCAVLFAIATAFTACAITPGAGGNQDAIAKAQVSVGAAYKALNDLFLSSRVGKSEALTYRSQLLSAENLLRQAEVAARSNDTSASATAASAATAIINQVTQALLARKGSS